MPMLRAAYQVRQTLNLDMDAVIELSHTETDTQNSDGKHQFFSLGLLESLAGLCLSDQYCYTIMLAAVQNSSR